MASFDNLIEPWMFKSTFTDPFYPDSLFAKETESAFTLALQQSLFSHPVHELLSVNPGDYNYYNNNNNNNNNNSNNNNNNSNNNSTTSSTGTGTDTGTARGEYTGLPGPNHGIFIPDSDRNLNGFSPLSIANANTTAAPSASTVTGSGSVSGSGSDPETPGSKRSGLGVVMGKTTKRKSRARSRATTTFIQADPANFRRMVQEVTGVKLGDGSLPEFTVVKPEPLRQPFVNKLQGLLPTLDTSAYLLDVHSNNNNNINNSRRGNIMSGGFPARSPVTENGGVGVDFYSCSSFPTLESSI